MKKYRGIFIAFEGNEGAGKTTISKKVTEILESKYNENVFLTREPGGSDLKISEDIRKLIMNYDEMDHLTELFLFNAARREHVLKKIKPNLKENKIVISDRFTDSTRVYQSKKIDINIINNINNITVSDENNIIFEPNCVFIFILEPKIAIERIKNNNPHRINNRFDYEKIEFHYEVIEKYMKLYKSNPDKYILVDANKSIDEITNFIIDKILDYKKENYDC